MTQGAGFVETAVRLMRLTRHKKIGWREEIGEPDRALFAPTLTGEVNGLRFWLEDARRRIQPSEAGYEWSPSYLRYRLVILDGEEEVVSPPSQAASDLASIIRDERGRLIEINRRLDEMLEH